MTTARAYASATRLPDGKVLIVGGYNGGPVSGAELYDPTSGTFSSAGTLAPARYGAPSVLLPDGKVLILGGLGISGALSDAYLYQ